MGTNGEWTYEHGTPARHSMDVVTVSDSEMSGSSDTGARCWCPGQLLRLSCNKDKVKRQSFMRYQQHLNISLPRASCRPVTLCHWPRRPADVHHTACTVPGLRPRLSRMHDVQEPRPADRKEVTPARASKGPPGASDVRASDGVGERYLSTLLPASCVSSFIPHTSPKQASQLTK